jgi:Uma2 family endonuclease
MTTDYNAVKEPIVLHMGPLLSRLTDDEFFDFCQLNRELRIERTSDGDLIILPPTGGKTGRRNVSLATQLENWSVADGTGVTFDSSTGFRLDNGAKRSPDASWVLKSRWDALTDDEQDEFPPLAPDFVVELRSRSDSVEDLKVKMAEYIANGVRLAWLLAGIPSCLDSHSVSTRSGAEQFAADASGA